MASQSPKFDHLIVLMMENRSFDSLLGYLYHPDNVPPFDQPPDGQVFNGIYQAFMTDSVVQNPVPSEYQEILGTTIKVHRAKDLVDFTCPIDVDPDHNYTDVQYQIYSYDYFDSIGSPCQSFNPPDNSWKRFMMGFVKNYINSTVSQYGSSGVTKDRIDKIMACYSPCAPKDDPNGQYAIAPVINTLAVNFAVCDNWHASVSSPTFCNRSFLHSAQSNGWVGNFGRPGQWSANTAITIFEKLLIANFNGLFDSKNAWRVYHERLDPNPLVFQLHPNIDQYNRPPYRASMEQFYADAQTGNLPAYSFIEPRIVTIDISGLPPDDEHPICDLRIGENLINDVFHAIASSPCWERTLLVIIYDEHGGIFDHVIPPSAVPPQSYNSNDTECGFTFDRFGVRVPAVLISPYIESRRVFHPNQPVDHTSVIKTLCNRWGISWPSNGRLDTACDLADVLTLDTPRSVEPISLPLWSLPSKPVTNKLNSLQRDVMKLEAARKLQKLAQLGYEEELRDFLNSASVLPAVVKDEQSC
jgi:phospholipase C